MIRFTGFESAEAAGQYFKKNLIRGTYYANKKIIPVQWEGHTAARLNLEGNVEQKIFLNLLNNIGPDGKQLTARTKKNRRPGWDATFLVPKSVSLLFAFFEDDEVEQIIQESVHETMQEMEQEAYVRIRKGKANYEILSRNLLWTPFSHYDSRPAPAMFGLPDGTSDPLYHIHCFIQNISWCPVDHCFKAVDISRIIKNAPYYQAAFHTRLTGKLQQLGFEIEPTLDAFEIKGISRDLICKFSRRSVQIDMLAEELGITNPKAKAKLGKKTAVAKKELPLHKLRALWKSNLTAKEANLLQLLRSKAEINKGKVIPHCPKQRWKGFSMPCCIIWNVRLKSVKSVLWEPHLQSVWV